MSYLKIAILGLIIGGLGVYLLIPRIPTNYTASGIFVVSRKADVNSAFFTYEGSYAEQTAVSFTASFLAILQSDEVKKAALEETKGLASNEDLKKLKRLVRVKKEGPRVLSLRVKATTESGAANTWNAIAQSGLSLSNLLIKDSDPALKVEKSLASPVITFSELNRFVGAGFGASAGAILGLFCYATFRYLWESLT